MTDRDEVDDNWTGAEEDDGLLDSSDTLEDDPAGEPLDVGYEPADRWSGANRVSSSIAVTPFQSVSSRIETAGQPASVEIRFNPQTVRGLDAPTMLIGGMMMTAFGLVLAGFAIAYQNTAPLDLNTAAAK